MHKCYICWRSDSKRLERILKSWYLIFYLDLKFVGRGKLIKEFKGNLFRIDKYKTQGYPTRYLAFNPGMNSPACFHQPLKFVDFKLV